MLKHTSRQLTLTAALTLSTLPLLLAVPSSAHAQSAGNISGTVTDPSGAIVPSATVTIKQTETNTTRTITTDAAGLFSFTNVLPGAYTLTTTATGFTSSQTTFTMTIGGNVVLNPKLTVGGSTTVVEVSSDQTANINTSSPEVSQVISAAEVSQLPSLTRNPYDFVALSGNVSSGDNTAAGNSQNGANRGVNFSLNGQRNSGTEILLDGVENISVFGDSVAVRVPIDAVQEYRIITNNFAPEYGRASGGVVAVATKAGTNALHGRVWEFNRISALTANTVSNVQQGNPKGNYTRNQFGGAIGGPIVKDKLFFYATTEFTRVRSAANLISTIPTSQFLAAAPANVQSFFSTYGPTNTGRVLSTTTNLQAGTAVNGGTPASLYPTLDPNLPVFQDVGFTAPTDAGGGLPQNTYNITGRVDWNVGQKTQTFFRYVNYHEVDQAGSAFASPYAQYNVGEGDLGTAYLLSLAHEFNPSVSTLTKLSFSRVNTDNTFNTALQNVPTLVVAPNALNPYTHNAFQLPGFYDTNPANGGLPYGGPQNTIQWNQDLNITRGAHQVQLGGQLLYIQDNHGYGAYAQANEQLGKNTNSGLNNFLAGNLYEYQVAVNPQGVTPCARNPYTGDLVDTSTCQIATPTVAPQFTRSNRFHDWAAYVQDQWRTSPRFTLNYGVRYEYFGVQHNNNQSLDSNFYYGAGTSIPEQVRNGQVLTTPNSPIGRLWNPQYGTVSPRLGFALDVFGNAKTSLRGGYGISYERNFGNVTFNVIQNPPNYAVVVQRATVQGPPTVTNSNSLQPIGSATSVSLPPTSLRHVDQNIRTAQTQFYSLAVDQQLGRGTVLEVAYNGSRGIHLYDIKNYNIPGGGNFYLGDPLTDASGNGPALTYANAKYSNDNNRGSNGDSYYHAVNVQFQTQDIRHTGFSIVANYTLAHATDDLSTAFSETYVTNYALGYTDPFNPGLDHGNSDFDIRNRFVLAPIWQSPSFSKNGHSYLAQTLGGWQVTGIYTLRTGTPFTFYDSTNDNSGYSVPRYVPSTPITQHTFKKIPTGVSGGGVNTYQIGSLPTAVPISNANLLGISDFGPYPSAMTARNAFRGPGAYNLDVSVSKTFPIHERLNLELRAEAFDVTNHHNLYIQGATLDVAQSAADSNAPYGPADINTAGSPYASGTAYPVLASKGGVAGGANDERRFLQFAGKINF